MDSQEDKKKLKSKILAMLLPFYGIAQVGKDQIRSALSLILLQFTDNLAIRLTPNKENL
jgi:hypothetical protein